MIYRSQFDRLLTNLRPNGNSSLKPSTLRQPARLLRPPLHTYGINADVFTQITNFPRGGGLGLTASSRIKLPFELTPIRDGDNWTIEVNNGTVLHTDTGTDLDPIRTYFDVPTEIIGVSDGDSLYAQVNTDNRGKPTSVVLMVATSDPDNTFPVPEIEDGTPSTGILHYKLGTVTITGSSISIKTFHIGAIEIQNILWASKNELGSGVSVLKGFDPAAGLYIFKKLLEKESDAQIKIEDVEDSKGIRIQGNGFNQTISDGVKLSIQVKDGMVVSLSEAASPGWSGTVEFLFTMADSGGSTERGWVVKFDFLNGILNDLLADFSNDLAGDPLVPVSVVAAVSSSYHINYDGGVSGFGGNVSQT